jgi:hypothetical protein
MKIYGPYLRKDGRKHVVIVHPDGRKQTKSYPRLLLEQKLGRELTKEETVDHKDDDFTNDSLDNLQILSLANNAKKSAIGNKHVLGFKQSNEHKRSGSKNGKAKLSDIQIEDIRTRIKYHGLIRDLANEFSVDRKTIQNILKNISYRP